jgi:hypothetical protein
MMSHLWATFEWITVLQNVDLAIFFSWMLRPPISEVPLQGRLYYDMGMGQNL